MLRKIIYSALLASFGLAIVAAPLGLGANGSLTVKSSFAKDLVDHDIGDDDD